MGDRDAPGMVLGVLECAQPSAGYGALDAALKAAPVTIVRVATITPGKLVWVITGDEASVQLGLEAAVVFAEELGDGMLVDRLYLPAASRDVAAAIRGGEQRAEQDAVAVIDTETVTAGVAIADVMAKRASVRISAIVMDDRMAGRASVRVTGAVGEIDVALEEANAAADADGRTIVQTVRIPRPHDDLWEHLELANGR